MGLRLSWLVGLFSLCCVAFASANPSVYPVHAGEYNQTKFCKKDDLSTVDCETGKALNELDDIALWYETDKSTRHHGYTLVYHQLFQHLRDKPIVFFEIGCFRGASALMWSEYFPKGQIYCMDLHPRATEVTQFEERVHVLIGNQGDEKDLLKALQSMPPPDVILDDGSHLARHMILSFKVLFPGLNWDGLYVIEDLHTSNDPSYVGGGCSQDNSFKFVQSLLSYIPLIKGGDASEACGVPTEDWQRNIKDVHVYGGSGIGVIHKGMWTAFDGQASSKLATAPATATVNPQFGHSDDQFMAWG